LLTDPPNRTEGFPLPKYSPNMLIEKSATGSAPTQNRTSCSDVPEAFMNNHIASARMRSAVDMINAVNKLLSALLTIGAWPLLSWGTVPTRLSSYPGIFNWILKGFDLISCYLLSTPFWGFYEKFLSVTNQRVVRYKILI